MKIGPYNSALGKTQTKSSIIFDAQTKAGRPTVVKVSQKELAWREFVMLAGFNHAHIVKVFTKGIVPDDMAEKIPSLPLVPSGMTLGWFSMEFLAARNLREELTEKGEGFLPQAVLGPMFAVSQALLPFWKDGGVHLDIKPGNIMNVPDRGWVLIDFGSAARYLYFQEKGERRFSFTPACAAPEYFSYSSAPDMRGDFFGAGATIFQLLFNQTLYDRSAAWCVPSISRWYRRHNSKDVFSSYNLSPRLLEFFLGACAFDRQKRVSDPDEFMGLLERAKEEAYDQTN